MTDGVMKWADAMTPEHPQNSGADADILDWIRSDSTVTSSGFLEVDFIKVVLVQLNFVDSLHLSR